MKGLILILFLPVFCSAQQIILLDRGFKEPIIVSDSVTTTELMEGWFPIQLKDVDSILKQLNSFKKHIDTGIPLENESMMVKVGNSNLISQIEKQGFGNTYYLALNTMLDNVGTTMVLLLKRDGRKRALQKLNIFIDYLRNNMSVLKDNNTFKY